MEADDRFGLSTRRATTAKTTIRTITTVVDITFLNAAQHARLCSGGEAATKKASPCLAWLYVSITWLNACRPTPLETSQYSIRQADENPQYFGAYFDSLVTPVINGVAKTIALQITQSQKPFDCHFLTLFLIPGWPVTAGTIFYVKR